MAAKSYTRSHPMPIRRLREMDSLEGTVRQIPKGPEEILGGSMRRTITVLHPIKCTAKLNVAPVAVELAVVQAVGLQNTVEVRASDKS
jgi:hypothetical protein